MFRAAGHTLPWKSSPSLDYSSVLYSNILYSTKLIAYTTDFFIEALAPRFALFFSNIFRKILSAYELKSLKNSPTFSIKD